QLDLLRAYQLVFIRMGEPDQTVASRLAAKFDAHFPARTDFLNRELVQLLVYLKSPTILSKTLTLIQQPSKPLSQEAMAELLARNQRYGGPTSPRLATPPDPSHLYSTIVLPTRRECTAVDTASGRIACSTASPK